MDFSAAVLPVSLLKPAPTVNAASALPSADQTAKRAQIAKTASSYEASFISIMLGQMFEGVENTTFGGGAGEAAFKSFLTDAMAKSMTRHGGLGLSKSLANEMLKIQGLSAEATTTSTSKPIAAAATAQPSAGPIQ